MRSLVISAASAAAVLMSTLGASAHAFLDSAVPAVGATVGTAPNELRLAFTQNVVVALCKVGVASDSGAALPTSKPVGTGSTSPELRVALPARLRPGTYKVTWHVVSVDTHPTSGSYRFTVGP